MIPLATYLLHHPLLNTQDFCLQCIKETCKKYEIPYIWQSLLHSSNWFTFLKITIQEKKMYKQNKAHYISPVTGSPQRPNIGINSVLQVPLPERETVQRAFKESALQYSTEYSIVCEDVQMPWKMSSLPTILCQA
jgi:hypothetical protein